MGRSVETIEEEILSNINSDPALATLTSQSKVSIYRLFVYIIAYAIYVHELIFDVHHSELTTAIKNQKTGRLPWYRTVALNFQYGFDLLPDQDLFDNGDATEEEIEASKIIRYAAVNESDDSRIIIKIAQEVDDELAPIDAFQRDAFQAYLDEIRYAGVSLTVVNFLPDRLFLNLQIERDPLVLDANGMSILNGNFPVNDAIDAYMRLLPFDGEFVKFDFLNYIKANAEGVVTPTALNIESSFIDPLTNDYGDPVSIPIKTIPFSGYFEVNDFDNITYVV